MSVYLLVHDDRMYDMGDTYVRGVYERREDAEAAIEVIAEGRWGYKNHVEPHDSGCCLVDERDVIRAMSAVGFAVGELPTE